jgi:hypothetical protein
VADRAGPFLDHRNWHLPADCAVAGGAVLLGCGAPWVTPYQAADVDVFAWSDEGAATALSSLRALGYIVVRTGTGVATAVLDTKCVQVIRCPANVRGPDQVISKFDLACCQAYVTAAGNVRASPNCLTEWATGVARDGGGDLRVGHNYVSANRLRKILLKGLKWRPRGCQAIKGKELQEFLGGLDPENPAAFRNSDMGQCASRTYIPGGLEKKHTEALALILYNSTLDDPKCALQSLIARSGPTGYGNYDQKSPTDPTVSAEEPFEDHLLTQVVHKVLSFPTHNQEVYLARAPFELETPRIYVYSGTRTKFNSEGNYFKNVLYVPDLGPVHKIFMEKLIQIRTRLLPGNNGQTYKGFCCRELRVRFDQTLNDKETFAAITDCGWITARLRLRPVQSTRVFSLGWDLIVARRAPTPMETSKVIPLSRLPGEMRGGGCSRPLNQKLE